jgi:hypothetical protein
MVRKDVYGVYFIFKSPVSADDLVMVGKFLVDVAQRARTAVAENLKMSCTVSASTGSTLFFAPRFSGLRMEALPVPESLAGVFFHQSENVHGVFLRLIFVE